ncbi:MAG: GNAT family N-acetyltransferase [Byssovorax sp.]
MTLLIRPTTPDEDPALLLPIGVAFGLDAVPARVDRLRAIPEFQMRLGAFDDDALVGSAGSWSFAMTTPGGVAVDVEGLTIVAVLPTHRRRGILREMMRSHLDATRARGKSVATLFASEGSIYGRFGYGMASLCGAIELDRDRSAFAGSPGAAAGARFRLVDPAVAAREFPPIWDRVRLTTPGLLSRTAGWWTSRRLSDPDWARAGRPPHLRVLCEIDGRPAGYAIYRLGTTVFSDILVGSLDVVEAVGDSPAATRAIWRYLCDTDLVRTVRASQLPIDHPLHHLVAEPGRVAMRLHDGLWIRLVDVAAALSQRGWEAEGPPLILGVSDAFCPWNQGSFRLAGGKAERTAEAPELSLDVGALGATYLGGCGFTQLADAGRAVEHTRGALLRADALFRAARAPWCPEIF